MLKEEGGVCLFHKNLREDNVYFKTRGGVSALLIDLRGGECNFPKKYSFPLDRSQPLIF